MVSDSVVYRCDLLFVLVSEQVIANFVTVCLLAKESAEVILIYTRNLATCANSLRGVLRKVRPDLRVSPIENESTDFQQLRKVIEGKSRTFHRDITIGLDFTGGAKPTAAAAVSVMRALSLEDLEDEHHLVSFLDERQGNLVIDVLPTDTPRLVEVGDLYTVELATLLELGGFSAIATNRQPKHMATCEILAGIVTQQSQTWQLWCTSNLQRSEGNMPMTPPLDAITASLMGTESDASFTRAAQVGGFGSVGELSRWLGGAWLEDYVLSRLQMIADAQGLGDMAKNIRVAKSGRYEIDVAAMRGYRLLALSCTMDSRISHVRSRLLEVLSQARMIGGDGAMAGIVSMLDSPSVLDREFDTTGQTVPTVRAFGKQHLLNLEYHLAQWIQDVENDQ